MNDGVAARQEDGAERLRGVYGGERCIERLVVQGGPVQSDRRRARDATRQQRGVIVKKKRGVRIDRDRARSREDRAIVVQRETGGRADRRGASVDVLIAQGQRAGADIQVAAAGSEGIGGVEHHGAAADLGQAGAGVGGANDTRRRERILLIADGDAGRVEDDVAGPTRRKVWQHGQSPARQEKSRDAAIGERAEAVAIERELLAGEGCIRGLVEL